MKIHVLGSGTSTGVPVPGCNCEVCSSEDPKNRRLRTSIYLELSSSSTDPLGVLIDTSPDLRYQVLRAGIKRIDSVLYTHTHADHIFGMDDLRAFNFLQKSEIPAYATHADATELRRVFRYVFEPPKNYQGGAPPKLRLETIVPYQSFQLEEWTVTPLLLKHGNLDVTGFRIGDFAYLTDCSYIPDETREHLHGLKCCILDGLRERPHKTHFTHQQAVAELEKIKPQKSYLIHITHEVDHEQSNKTLARLTELDVELAYDGLVVDLNKGSF